MIIIFLFINEKYEIFIEGFLNTAMDTTSVICLKMFLNF